MAGQSIRYRTTHMENGLSDLPVFQRLFRSFGSLSGYTSNSRTWYTIAMYNPVQINNSSSDPCDHYTRHLTSDQQFAFTHVWITEQ